MSGDTGKHKLSAQWNRTAIVGYAINKQKVMQ